MTSLALLVDQELEAADDVQEENRDDDFMPRKPRPLFPPFRHSDKEGRRDGRHEHTRCRCHSRESIAVLSIESLSSDQENAYFADGVQDQILTDLARIADLKVISRTSVMQCRKAGARWSCCRWRRIPLLVRT